MIIIVEGTDGTGKSTLCKKIAEQYNISYYKEKLSYEERLSSDYDGFTHYFKLVNMIYHSKEKMVCDRLHLGEFVNPIIYKDGRKPLTIKEISEIEFPIQDEAILISTTSSDNFIRNSLSVRGDDVAKVENIKYMKFLYEHVSQLSSIKNKINWDPLEDINYNKIFQKLDVFFKKNN